MINIGHRKLLEKLIQINTVNPPGNELEAAGVIRDFLEPLGFDVRIHDMGNNRGNITASYGSGTRPSVMLTGHLDVVAADGDWSSDPFKLIEKDGNYYGRGTSDMKGAISSMMAAAERFAKEYKEPSGKLILLFVADEEIHGTGTRAILEQGPYPDYAVIGEPTEMNVAVAHRGVSRYHIEFHGKGGHASRPDDSINPVYPAAAFLTLVDGLNEELRSKKHWILPSPTITATVLEAGLQGNTIPDLCKITVDRRTVPGETKAFIEKEIEELVGKISPKLMEGIEIRVDFVVSSPATEPRKEPGAASICEEVLKAMSLPAQIRDFPAGCDQYMFMERGIDCVLVGPGSIEQAHITNEYVSDEQLMLAEQFYFEFIKKCLVK